MNDVNDLFKYSHKPLKKEIEGDSLQKMERSPMLMDW
jgi:hypothetical protein